MIKTDKVKKTLSPLFEARSKKKKKSLIFS